MKSLLIEEKDKRPTEIVEKFLVKIWPNVYAVINGLVSALFTTVIRILQLILEQIGFRK